MIAMAMRDEYRINLRNIQQIKRGQQLRCGFCGTCIDEHASVANAQDCRIGLAKKKKKNREILSR